MLTAALLSLVPAAFPANKRAVAVSLWGAVGGLAAAVGPSLDAFVIASLGWQWAFYLNVLLGMLAIWRGNTADRSEAANPGAPAGPGGDELADRRYWRLGAVHRAGRLTCLVTS